MSRVTLKSSTIFISVGEKTSVYRSVDEVPPRLRKKLEQSTNGMNSATILIADRRGRQEIARAIRGLPSGVRSSIVPGRPETAGVTPEPPAASAAIAPAVVTPARSVRHIVAFVVRHWAEILIPPAIGAIVWFLSTLK